jgi:hypothetical protein
MSRDPMRSRRAVLAAAAGAVAAAAAAAVVQPLTALADDTNQPILVGSQFSDVRSVTSLDIEQSGNNSNVFAATQGGGTGTAIWGFSKQGTGVFGQTYATDNYAVYGSVGGAYISHATSAGVFGENAFDGKGVWGTSQHGIAVYAQALNTDAVAIRAEGVTQFTRSGYLTIKAGKSAAVKTNLRIDAKTLVLAVLQDDRPGIYVRSAVTNSGAGSFTIHLNAAVSSDTRVGWFLVN